MNQSPPTTPTAARQARLDLLQREKELTRLSDDLACDRRALPPLPVQTDYQFDTPTGPAGLKDLFAGHSQLLVYHFMFGPDWDAGCPSCSFWADGFNGAHVHLAQRDTAFVAVSRAPLPKLLAYRDRMGWSFPWVSSAPSDFNRDFRVSFDPGRHPGPAEYNYTPAGDGDEMPGLSAFALDDAGAVCHTYSCYARGLEAFNPADQFLDLTVKGRDEDALPWTMAWLRRHDEYDA